MCMAFCFTFQTLRRLGTVKPAETPLRAVRAPKGTGAAAVAVPVATVPYVYSPPSGDGVTLPRVWQYNKAVPETPGATSPNILIPDALTSESADNSHAVKSKFSVCLYMPACMHFPPLCITIPANVIFPLAYSSANA